MSLKKIPESEKPILRQFFQNARGRADLKQPAGFLTLLTLLYCAAISATISDALVFTLGAVIVLWWVGDTTEAVAVLKALYGGYQQKATTEINNTSQGTQSVTTPTGDSTTINQQVPTEPSTE
jgi:hypothetical protein